MRIIGALRLAAGAAIAMALIIGLVDATERCRGPLVDAAARAEEAGAPAFRIEGGVERGQRGTIRRADPPDRDGRSGAHHRSHARSVRSTDRCGTGPNVMPEGAGEPMPRRAIRGMMPRARHARRHFWKS